MIFRRDPCGIICIIFSYFLIIYADYVVVTHFVFYMSGSAWGAFHAIIFNLLVFAQVFAHVRTVTSDPGIVPLPAAGLDFSDVRTMQVRKQEEQALTADDWTVCQRCETYRPPRAHHCKICRRCIRRMDHHCPWVNNCIGEKNQKFFVQFLFYTGVLCLYALSLDIASWVSIVKDAGNDHLPFVKKQAVVGHSIAVCIEALLFGLFVVAMLWDQMSSILDDETGVEHVINKKRPKSSRPRKPKMSLIRDVFGHGPVYRWFMPCSSTPNVTQTSFSYDV